MKFTSRAIKKYARAHSHRFRIHIRLYVWWVQTIAGIFMTGPQISGAVTREWDLHGTEGIEFHGSCFFFFYAASAPRLAGI